MTKGKELLKKHFKCNAIGKKQDDIGCKIMILDDGRSLKKMQLVLVTLNPGDFLTNTKIATS